MATIDSATPDNIPFLAGLLAVLFTQEADFRPDREKQERGLRLLLGSPGLGTIFVARDGGEVVERLTIRHVNGTLLAVRRVMQVTGLVRGLDRLLFGE
jgi:hypothetical protein